MHQFTSSYMELYLLFCHSARTLRSLQNYPELLVLFNKAMSPHFIDSLNQICMYLKAQSSAMISVGFHCCINQESQQINLLFYFLPPNFLFRHARTLRFVPQHFISLKALDENFLKILLENPVEHTNRIFLSNVE